MQRLGGSHGRELPCLPVVILRKQFRRRHGAFQFIDAQLPHRQLFIDGSEDDKRTRYARLPFFAFATHLTMLHKLNARYPVRYTVFGLSVLALLGCAVALAMRGVSAGLALLLAELLALVVLGLYDLAQSRRSILRNYPIIGHIRHMLEFVRPELRQYFLESDSETAPFSRSQRSLVYQRAKGESDLRPFGTLYDVRAEDYEWVNHAMVPTTLASHDFRVWIGGTPEQAAGRNAASGLCTQPYHASVFNISGMSFGALSANAILALNAGAAEGGFAHDTGEGSISVHHRRHGGDLIWQIASGYFGCRSDDGHFDPERFVVNALDPQVKMIEIKLSQGAKPGHGGVLPGAKVTPEIAHARGVRVDGAEGGTGAAPVEFTNHVGSPLQEGLTMVHNTLRGVGLRNRIRIGCAGKVISAFDIVRMIALGADWCNSGRGYMFALGCVQAQTCHTGNCPTGVTTQDPLRQKSLVVPDKARRVFNYHAMTLHAREFHAGCCLKWGCTATPMAAMRRCKRSTCLSLLSSMARCAAARSMNGWSSASPQRMAHGGAAACITQQ